MAVGSPLSTKCCTLLKGLADSDAGLYLCTAIKNNILGLVKLDVLVAIRNLVISCICNVTDYKVGLNY